MTVKQLKEKLNEYPDEMDVFMAERKTEFAYGLLNSVKQKKIGFSEEEDGEIEVMENVVILDEE